MSHNEQKGKPKGMKEFFREVDRELDRYDATPSLSVIDRIRSLGARSLRLGQLEAAQVRLLAVKPAEAASALPQRRRLPDERKAVTHHFEIHVTGANKPDIVDGYLTVGVYDDGAPGEFFIRIGRGDASLRGLDGWAAACSLLLQYGVPLEVITNKFSRWAFEPSGLTKNKDIGICSSIFDYVTRWLDQRYAVRERSATP